MCNLASYSKFNELSGVPKSSDFRSVLFYLCKGLKKDNRSANSLVTTLYGMPS